MPALGFPAIEIDHHKCATPFDCKKCLQACGQSVFSVGAVTITFPPA